MQFTSLHYLAFLAVFCCVYWMTDSQKVRNVQLLVGSYLFYGWASLWYCVLLLISTAVTYVCLHALWSKEKEQRSRLPLVACIVFNIGILVLFKYWGYFIGDFINPKTASPVVQSLLNVILPLGLSFYSLQAVGLVADAYKGEVPRQGWLEVSVFLAFFPKLISGPFEKAGTFFPQIAERHAWDWANLSGGLSLMIFGFFKKLVIADNISPYVDRIFLGNPVPLTVLFTGGLCFAVQILADFSGYTDLARGSARLLGINLMENFNYPYLALTPSDFWRRWHISLSKWFTTYVYIPLGGSRTDSKLKLLFTTLVTMGASGLWHGATVNFLLWGLYYGILLFVYQLLKMDGHWVPRNAVIKWTARTVMFFWTVLGWILFKASSLTWLLQSVRSSTGERESWGISLMAVWLSFAAFFVILWTVPVVMDRFVRHPLGRGVMYACLIACILILGQEAAGDFVYFQF